MLEAGIEKSTKKVPKKYKPELISGYEQTANMGGRVSLRVLTQTNVFKGVIDYESRAKKIQIVDHEFIKQYGEDVDLGKISITSKKVLLKTHKAHRLTRKNTSMREDEALKATNSIEPFCKEMKDVLSMQNEIM